MLRPLLWCVLLALVAPMLSACSRPEPPDKERPPEPQAETSTELRDAIRTPIEKAEGVEDDVQKGADNQRQAIEDAGG